MSRKTRLWVVLVVTMLAVVVVVIDQLTAWNQMVESEVVDTRADAVLVNTGTKEVWISDPNPSRYKSGDKVLATYRSGIFGFWTTWSCTKFSAQFPHDHIPGTEFGPLVQRPSSLSA